MRKRGLFAEKPLDTAHLPTFRAEHFPYSGPYPWLDLADAQQQIHQRLGEGRINAVEAEVCAKWAADGYVILPGLIETATLHAVWDGYEAAIAKGRITLESDKASADDPWPGRFLNPHKKSAVFCRILKHPGLLHAIRLLMDREPRPLQTITSHKGSQQAVHSDSIHMTTYPLGYLSAAWIAFEDIHPDSGPLVYYPGSHKLPYVFSKDVGISGPEFKERGYAAYQERYEPHVAATIERHRLQPSHFHARKGDVLIWHANLLHGGSARKDMQLSRRALVCHFYVKGAFVYHDLAATQSRQQYMSTCLLRDENGRMRLLPR